MRTKTFALFTLILLGFAALVLGLFFSSCQPEKPMQSWHEKRYSGSDSTVYVRYVDDNGQQQSFFMDWLLFNSLYSHGGYNNCYSYYHTHPAYFNSPRYRSYNTYSSPVIINHNTHNYIGNGSTGSTNPGRSYSSPSRTNGPSYRNYSSPSRASSSPSSRSYSSPSRSSYSSPSRSYSSPSRSYSSPSRSYSSPSRSSGRH